MRYFCGAALILAAPMGRACAADEPDPAQQSGEASVGMKMKLDLSKQLLAALATADYEVLAKRAAEMDAINQVEDFVRGQSPEYRTQLLVFQFASKELKRNAEERNLDGATLSYTQMTLSCVNCHRELRRD